MSDRRTRSPMHVRTIRVEATPVGDAELEVTGRLVDERPDGGRWFGLEGGSTIHDMTLTLRVRYPDLVITHAAATMDERPYTLCPDALPGIARLVGLSVARGFVRAVNERFGRERGCAHMTALVHAMAPVVKQGAGAAFVDDNTLPTSDHDLWFVDSCQAWREGGPLERALRAGDVETLRDLSTRMRAPETPA